MNKFRWCIKRLYCMSFQEVAYRLYKSMVTNLYRFKGRDLDIRKVLRDRCGHANFYFDPGELDMICERFPGLFPDRIKHVISEADLLCGHKFRIFNSVWETGEGIDWHRDFATQERWPLCYWADIDFRNSNNSKEVRFIWELNRQQHLVTLGKAFALTGNDRYALEVKNQILSWIEQNPPYMGINWTSPLELSLRLISWCWAYRLIEKSGIFSKDEKEEFFKAIYMQSRFIERNLSRFSSANNHIIGEACGLAITALTFPQFKDSERWLKTGKRILFREILKQVHADGVTKEQAFHYQGFVMEFFILAAQLMIKNNIAIPKDAMNRFFSMAKFVINIIDSKGRVPNIGDSDNGRAIRLSGNKDFALFSSILTSACILSGRGDFKKKGSSFEEEHLWVFGLEGLERYNPIAKENTELNSRLFEKGGYAVFRNGKEEVLIMDCGGLGYKSIAAHGHADLLSIALFSNGSELLIDPGTYLYHTDSRWRDYFRGTSAHNTITVDGKNQSEIKGPFMWGKRPFYRVKAWSSSSEVDYIEASYRNSINEHKRTIYFYKKKETWIIKDYLTTGGQSTIRQYFHLTPHAIVKRIDDNIIEVQNQGVFLYMILDEGFSVDIKKGERGPIAGWSSDVFGVKRETPTLVNTALINEKSKFVTILHLSDKRLEKRYIEDNFKSLAGSGTKV